MDAETRAAEGDAGDLQLRMEVRVAPVVVQRYERVEQVDAARQEDRDSRRIGRRCGLGGSRLEDTRSTGIAFAP